MTKEQFLKLKIGAKVMNNQGDKLMVRYLNAETNQLLMESPKGYWSIWIPAEAELLQFVPRERPPTPETPTILGYELDRYAGSGDINSPDLYSLRFDRKAVAEYPFKIMTLDWQYGYVTARGPLYAKVEE